MSVKQPARWGEKSIKAPAIYITLHQFDVTLETLRAAHSTSLSSPVQSSTPTGRSWRDSAFDQPVAHFSHVFMNPCKAYFHQRMRPGLEEAAFALRPRYQTWREKHRKADHHASTRWSRRIFQLPRSVFCRAGSFPQPPAASCSQLVWTYCNVCECEWARNLLCNTAATMHLKCLGAGSN